MKRENRSGLVRSLRSFAYAGRGLGHLLRTQTNARIHLAAALAVVLLGFWCALERNEWLWLVLAIGLVFVAEGFNTALEHLADAVQPEYHPLVEKAKDVAAAAVLLAAVTAAIIGLLLFAPCLFSF